MISATTRIFVATQPADMRRSIDGLGKCVREQLLKDPSVQGALFVFANKRRDRAKVLWRDATGWCLLYKRLDTRRLVLPAGDNGAASVVIDARALSALLDGVDAVRRRPTAREIVREARQKVAKSGPTSTTRR